MFLQVVFCLTSIIIPATAKAVGHVSNLVSGETDVAGGSVDQWYVQKQRQELANLVNQAPFAENLDNVDWSPPGVTQTRPQSMPSSFEATSDMRGNSPNVGRPSFVSNEESKPLVPQMRERLAQQQHTAVFGGPQVVERGIMDQHIASEPPQQHHVAAAHQQQAVEQTSMQLQQLSQQVQEGKGVDPTLAGLISQQAGLLSGPQVVRPSFLFPTAQTTNVGPASGWPASFAVLPQPSPSPIGSEQQKLVPSPAPGSSSSAKGVVEQSTGGTAGKTKTKLSRSVQKGAKLLPIDSNAGFTINATVRVNPGGPTEEDCKVVGFGSLIIAEPLRFSHTADEVIEQLALPTVERGTPPKTGPTTIGNYTVEQYPVEEVAPWGYSGDRGAGKWGDLTPEYSVCKSGTHQSPIDVVDIRVARFLPLLITSYKDSTVTLKNDGHGINIPYESGSYFNFGQAQYELFEIQFHTPSEHKLDGFALPMEIQLIHKSDDGTTAVLSVFAKIGDEPNAFLDKVWEFTPTVAGTLVATDLKVNAVDLLPLGNNYFAYYGSMTRPPCTEGWKWFVLRDTITISKKHVDRLRAIVATENARPTQFLNDRTVEVSILNTLS